MNLIEKFPRSPTEKFNGLVHILRMVDKANAKRDGLLGEYIFPCPIDKIMLQFLGLSELEFTDKIYNKTDSEIQKYIVNVLNAKQKADIENINEKILNPKPKIWKKVYRFIFSIFNPSKKEFRSWVDRVDYEEGRL